METIGTTPGLSSAQAAARLAADGPNRLPPPKRPSALARFSRQLFHFFALMLWVAGALAFVAGLAELGIAVFCVIVLNAVFAFLQENRADRAAERLRELLPTRVTVRRDARRMQVDAADVVVGDVVVLDPGDRIPADATLTQANRILVDMSMLTGESAAVVLERGGEVFAGTFAVEGEAEAVVTATGTSTRLAAIAAMTTATGKPATPLTVELRRVVQAVAAIAVGVGGVFFGIMMALGSSATDGFIFAIGVTVALVPEALLPTVTLSLAWGAEQMAKRNVLVRRLDAVETLGSTTFICTDKTGTLTCNQMAVVEAWTPHGMALISGSGYGPTATVVLSDPQAQHSIERLAIAGARCSVGYVVAHDGGWLPRGDPMEAALDSFARRLSIDVDRHRAEHPLVTRFPFEPSTRRMSVVVDGEVLVKGAPDTVLPLCIAGEEDLTKARDVLDALTSKGLRVLAVGGRPAGEHPPQSAQDAEQVLTLYGLVGLEDPPRPDVRPAIDSCRRAGIKLAMVTGDHPATAAAVANEVGLRSPDGTVVCSDDLPEDEEMLGALLDRDGIVVARVSPETKLRIARALKRRGHVVAMTGDGVNDGPALHEADIGIAMGESGTDVAREAADLVLLDDHFASIVAGIEQGRATFVNIRRFLTYHLTDNVAELTPFVAWALSAGHFPLALGVLQILALDLGTDTFSAVALGAEPPAEHLLDGPPVSGRLLNHTVVRRAFGVLGPTEALWSMFAFLVALGAAGWRPGDSFPEGHALAAASGAAFIAVVVAQTANALACRSSTRSPWALGWLTNRMLLLGIGFALLFSLTVLFFNPIARELGQAGPPLLGWATVALAAPVLLAMDTADKRVTAYRRKRRLTANAPD